MITHVSRGSKAAVLVAAAGALLQAGCGQRIEDLSTEIAERYETSGEFFDGDLEQFVAALGNDLLQNYIIMTSSESAQTATAAEPRIIFHGTDSRDVYCVSTVTMGGNLTERFVEHIRWDDTDKVFDFAEWNEVDIVGYGTVMIRDDSEAKRDTCRACHGQELRPNWDAYDSWGGMLPFHRDRLYDHVPGGGGTKSHSQELLAYRRIMANMATNPIGQYLQLPAGVTRAAAAPHAVTVTFPACGAGSCDGNIAAFNIPAVAATELDLNGVAAAMAVDQGGAFFLMKHPNKPAGNPPAAADEGQGIAMFDQFSDLNGEKILEEHKDHADYADFKYVAKGILDGCIPQTPTKADLEKWAEAAHLEYISGQLMHMPVADYDDAYADLKTDTLDRRKSLPRRKVNSVSQVENLEALILANADWVAATGENGGKIRYDGNDYTKAQLQANNNTVLNQIIAQELFRRKQGTFDYDEKELIIDREQYDAATIGKYITQWRFFLEAGHDVGVDKWSLSVMGRSRTYTFADIFDSKYRATIRTGLAADADLMGKNCVALETASKAQLDGCAGGCCGPCCSGGCGPDGGIDADPGPGSGSGGEPDGGIDADPGPGSGSGGGTEPDGGIDADPGPGSGSGTYPDPGTGGTDPGPGSGSGYPMP